MEFPEGEGVQNKTFHGGSMDIFWNCTVVAKLSNVNVFHRFIPFSSCVYSIIPILSSIKTSFHTNYYTMHYFYL